MSRYDVEKFTPPPDPDLVCCICQCVLDGPVESPCRHVFCRVCIETWLVNNRNCPNCRRRLRKPDLQPVLPLVQNMLNRLQMFCDFRDNGCIQVVSLEIYDKHIKDCEFEMLKCKYEKCGQSLLRRDMRKHEEELCDHREKLCQGQCGLMIPISIFDTHNCVEELHKFVSERESLVQRMNQKITELSNLTERLNQQIEELRQELRHSGHYFSDWSYGSDNETSSTYYSGDDTYSDYNSNDNNSRDYHPGRDRGLMTFEEFDREDRNFWRNLRFRRTDHDDNGNYDHSPRSRARRYALRRTSEQSTAQGDGSVSEVDVVNTPPRSPSDSERSRSRTPMSIRSRSNSSSSSTSSSDSSARSRHSNRSIASYNSSPPLSPWSRSSIPRSPFSSRRSDSNDSRNSDSNDSGRSVGNVSVESDSSTITHRSRRSEHSNHSSSSHSSARRSWMEGRDLTPAIRGHYTFDCRDSPSSHKSDIESRNEHSDTDGQSDDSMSSDSTVVEQPRSRSSSPSSSHSDSSRTYDYKRQHSTSCGYSGVGSDEDSRQTSREDGGSSPSSLAASNKYGDNPHSDTENVDNLSCSPRSDSTVLDYMDSPTSQDADPAQIKSDILEPGRFHYDSEDSVSDRSEYHQDGDCGDSDGSRAESWSVRQDAGNVSPPEENSSDSESDTKEITITPSRNAKYNDSGYSDACRSYQPSVEITFTENGRVGLPNTQQRFSVEDSDSKDNVISCQGTSAGGYGDCEGTNSSIKDAHSREMLSDQETGRPQQMRERTSPETRTAEGPEHGDAEGSSIGSGDGASPSRRKKKCKKGKSALKITKFLKHEKAEHSGTVGFVSMDYDNPLHPQSVMGPSQNCSIEGCCSLSEQVSVRKRKKPRTIQSDSSDNEAMERTNLWKQAKYIEHKSINELLEKQEDLIGTSAVNDDPETGGSCRREDVLQERRGDSAIVECEPDSDDTWEPDPTERISEDSDSLSDSDLDEESDYEVEIPKTVADFLNEYCSDDSDEDWHP